MGDQFLAQVRDFLEMPIDFPGQQKAEFASTLVLVVTGLVALICGYILESIHVTLWVGLGGAAFTFFIAVPPWPIYNEDPEKWLNTTTRGGTITVDSKKTK